MIIKDKKYVIASKVFPLQFLDKEYMSDEIHRTELYDSKEDAKEYIEECLDEPNEFQILEVKITYEF